MRLFRIYLPMLAACSLLTGCVVDYAHVTKVNMEVTPAPEMRGASGYMKSGQSDFRLSGSVNVGETEEEKIKGLKNPIGSGCDSKCRKSIENKVSDDVEATYTTGYPYLAGSFEHLNKNGIFLWSWGVSVNRGTSGFLTLGLNTKHFEFGISDAVWWVFRDFEYSAEYYDDLFARGEDNSFMTLQNVLGAYASVYLDKVSLNYSISAYRPTPSYSDTNLQADFDLPYVLTEYITVGYRFSKTMEARLGVVNLFGEFPGWHWSGFGSFSINL